jgi:DNA-binding NarL/FixJ family response regulator
VRVGVLGVLLQGILVADDSAAVRRAVRSYLTARNLPVCGEAEDGVDAIERAKELKPDLILLDLAMPRLNGLEAALVLKRQMPNVRTVLFTMYSEAVSRAFASKLLWVDAVIAKADGMDKLGECVERLLGTSTETLF